MPLLDAGSNIASRLHGRRPLAGVLVTALAAALAVFAFAPAGALGKFQVGLQDPLFNQATPSALTQSVYGTLRDVAASTIRIQANWGGVAPATATEPAGFDPTNPADPHYHWAAVDVAVRNAADHHVRPLLVLYGAPPWAQPAGEPPAVKLAGGSWAPDPIQFGRFAAALASRYGGQFPDPLRPGASLPRVKLFEVLNEENLGPQVLAAPDLVGEYRSLLNAAYGAIKAVHHNDQVAIGGMSPVNSGPGSTSPLKFAAQLLCLRRVHTHFVRGASCPVRAHFDDLAMHPYALADTPTKHAYRYDDILVADMGKLHTLLQAAETLHTARPRIHYGLWVTEFSWFSNPPNPVIGDRDPVAARYTASSMYEMWNAGVNMVVWLLVRYEPAYLAAPPAGIYGGGLFTVAGQPTLKLRAFAFPVFASVSGRHGYVWGRAPVKRRTKVFVQHAVGRKWRTVGTVRTSADGIFQLNFSARGNGRYRARIRHGLISVPYDSRSIPGKRIHASNTG